MTSYRIENSEAVITLDIAEIWYLLEVIRRDGLDANVFAVYDLLREAESELRHVLEQV